MEINIQTQYSLLHLIKFAYFEKVENVWDSKLDGMAIFVLNNEDPLDAETKVFLDYINPDKYQDNPEGYSSFIIENNLDILCLGSIFLDVIDFYKSQKLGLDSNLIIESLKYYLEEDDFLDIQ